MSWNLAGYCPNFRNIELCKELMKEISKKMKNPDIIVMNFQEVIELKPNASAVADLLIGSKKIKLWTQFFSLYFLKENENYFHLTHNHLGTLACKIFVKKTMKNHVSLKHNLKQGFGAVNLGRMTNKGFCLSSLKVYDSSMIFINTHLPSGQKDAQIKIRDDKVKEIFNYVSKNGEVSNYDVLFLAGDLNLRTFSEKIPKSFLEIRKNCDFSAFTKAHEKLKKKLLEEENEEDDISEGINKGLKRGYSFIEKKLELYSFQNPNRKKKDEDVRISDSYLEPKFGWLIEKGTEEYRYLETDEVKKGLHTVLGVTLKEGRLPKFPSYKFNLKSNGVDYHQKRRPSWTDRIFYHDKSENLNVKKDELYNFYVPYSDHM